MCRPFLTPNAQLMTEARAALRGHWKPVVGLAAIMLTVYGLCALFNGLGSVVELLLKGPLEVGLAVYFLSRLRGGTPHLALLRQGFYPWRVFASALVACLLISLLTLLWALLLVVPGIVAALSYAMTFFILADAPAMGVRAAMRQSRRMMVGHKWKLFCLWGRFSGWLLLGGLTLGVGFLWILPYLWCSLARFYLDLCALATPSAERAFRPVGDLAAH